MQIKEFTKLFNDLTKGIRVNIIQESGLKIAFKVFLNLEKPNKEARAKFINDFLKGFNNRASVRVSNKSHVKPDKIVDVIIHSRLPNLSNDEVTLISSGHRVAMSAENILGLMLEEYIHYNVLKFGWTCCWGNVMKSIDFVSSKGIVLQVKNRSNSENSSSSKIRVGTEIIKWHRIDANTGITHWEKLNELIGNKTKMSEDDFSNFVKKVVKKNPRAIFIDEDSELWKT
jgi:hypothetical protein